MNLKKLLFLSVLMIRELNAAIGQIAEISGQNICSDGNQRTTIKVVGMDPEKFYALYLDDKMLQIRRSASKGTDNSLSFGEFGEAGVYTVAVFDKAVEGFPRKSGKSVKGSVVISPMPVVFVKDTLKVKSGETFHYIPKSNLPETSFSWVSLVKYGAIKGNTKKGSGPIQDVLQVEGNKAGCLVYSITPYRSVNENICTGEARNLVIIISPPK